MQLLLFLSAAAAAAEEWTSFFFLKKGAVLKYKACGFLKMLLFMLLHHALWLGLVLSPGTSGVVVA
jgi:hypothetical protein